MNIFAVEIWYDESELCNFYTVRWENSEVNETDHFFEQYENEENQYCNSAYELFWLITHSIGNVYGATNDFFDRNKNNAQALPPKPKNWIPEIMEIGIHFPLRLYCFRISESIVVLFNGGIKDQRTDQLSQDISLKFYEAQQFATRIANALQDGSIIISEDNRTLTNFQGTTDIIL